MTDPKFTFFNNYFSTPPPASLYLLAIAANSCNIIQIETPFYYPENVTGVLAIGSSCFIGLVDDTTVMKYPHGPNDKAALAALVVEVQILEVIGFHDRIIRLEGWTSIGLLLEYTCHGSLGRYLRSHNPTIQQWLIWATQAAEAMTIIHKKGVMHCDISVKNLLLDAELNIKLCDFQGHLLAPTRLSSWMVSHQRM